MKTVAEYKNLSGKTVYRISRNNHTKDYTMCSIGWFSLKRLARIMDNCKITRYGALVNEKTVYQYKK